MSRETSERINLKTGNIVSIKQGSMELYAVAGVSLVHIGNVQQGSNAECYVNAIRLYANSIITIDDQPVKIELSALTRRPRVFSLKRGENY